MSEQHESVAPLSQPPSAQTAEAIATLGYVYGYPLVLMDATRAAWGTPANRFDHIGTFPDPTFRQVVRPNVDTLYSSAWLDVGKEPIVLSVPDLGRRFYMMPLLDAWTNVFASPGTRTTGNGKGAFAIVGPGWRGNVPSTVEAIQSPTAMVWLIGRTYTAGKRDYDAVHAIQRQYQLTPLSAFGKNGPPVALAGAPAAPPVPAAAGAEPPVQQVDRLGAEAFFARLAQLMAANPPAGDDQPLVQRLAQIGVTPGEPFDLARLPASIADAVEAGVAAGRARLHGATIAAFGKPVNGWRIPLDVGRYGTSYEQRALVAFMGLGANLPEDAVYPGTDVDAAGQPLSGEHRYLLRFPPGGLPPVKAFWSVTVYGPDQFLAANPIGRHALGDRDPMRAAPDGTLDIYIQHDDPGDERRANWLPAPAAAFSLSMRLYHPKPPVLDGSWTPPAVVRV
jgi:hypothetical protein